MTTDLPVVHTQLEKSRRLLELTREISGTLDLDALLQSIVDAAAELTNSEQASIARYDRADQSLQFIAARWMAPEIMETMRVPINASISGQAFREKTPQIVQDAQKDRRLFSIMDEESGFTTKSMLAVPMMIQGQATGVLTALNKLDGASFDDQDLFVMENLAAQAAIAIHNAELLNASQEAFEHMAELDNMKSNFVSITSHELRIPLGLVLGHASYLKEIVDGEPLKQVEVIERAALRLKSIVEDLSRVETMQSGTSSLRLAEVDLRHLLNNILEDHGPDLEKDQLTLHKEFPEQAILVEAEADKLATVFEHLIRNAITFTNAEGFIEVGVTDEGDHVAVHVADTGIGIPESDLQRIFERFYQVEAHMTRRHGGMGLGLSVSKMLVEMHEGTIEVQSVEGKGSRFTVHLPKRQSQAAES